MQSQKVIVCQHGGRRRYAVPRMFEKAGYLKALYTDSSSFSALGRVAGFAPTWAPKSIGRLANRKIEGISTNKIFSTDYVYIFALLTKLVKWNMSSRQRYILQHNLLSNRMQKWGLQEASHLYSMEFENLRFVQWAKERGLKSIIDLVINPLTDKIMIEEEKRYPDWSKGVRESWVETQKLYLRAFNLADYLLCPSDWVASGAVELEPEVESKIRIVPYGNSINFGSNINDPVLGRVLFAGGSPLRKGLRDLGAAADLLCKKLDNIDIRVAGHIDDHVKTDNACKNLNFLGKLSTKEMKTEFLSADVFVLPSLSEGLPAVVAEAIGAGCPVIVTKEAGCPIQHEREGLVVPARDGEKLASAIQRMLQDRDLRAKCAENCVKMRPFFSEHEWSKRLFQALSFN